MKTLTFIFDCAISRTLSTNESENFSRMLHDYSDERKGFVIWRDELKAIMI